MYHSGVHAASFIISTLAVSCITCCKGSNSTLNVEGGESLVGEHCPGTVRLFCGGVDLPFVRWKYDTHRPPINDGEIHSVYPTEDSNQLVHLENNPAFLTVNVLSISKTRINGLNVANFSTILTVDLIQLAEQSITSISCGGNQLFTELVNVSILQPSFNAPSTLNITSVLATYHLGSLNSVDIQWTKLKPNCHDYESSLSYEMKLISFEAMQMIQVNHSSCEANTCQAIFMGDFMDSSNESSISVRAENLLKMYPISIGHQRHQHFIPEAVTTSCYIIAQCKSVTKYNDGTCIIEYTTDSTNGNVLLSNYVHTALPLNTITSLPYLLPGTLAYLHFLVILNGSLFISENITVENSWGTIVPDTPKISSMLGVYSNRGQLEYVDFKWVNLINACEIFMGSSVHYNLVINDSDGRELFSVEVGSNECLGDTCSVTILTTAFTRLVSIQFTLAAINIAGTTFNQQNTQIYQTSGWYYRPKITFLNCSALQIGCFTSTNVHSSTICRVFYYGTDSQYEHINSAKSLLSDGTTDTLQIQPRTEMHYITFGLNVSSTIEIQDRFTYFISDLACSQDDGGLATLEVSTVSQSDNNFTETERVSNEVIIGVSTGLTSLVCLPLIVIIVIIAVVVKRNIKSGNKTICRDTGISMVINNSERSPSPVYEEINELQVKQIEVNRNEAYAHYTQETVYYN